MTIDDNVKSNEESSTPVSQEPVRVIEVPTIPTQTPSISSDKEILEPKKIGTASALIDELVLFNKSRPEVNEIVEAFINILDKGTKEEKDLLTKNLKDDDSYESKIREVYNHMNRMETNVNLIAEMLTDAKKHGGVAAAEGMFGSQISMPEPLQGSIPAGPKRLSGKQGKVSLIRNIHGYAKTPLFNSGIWVVIKPFSIAELNSFFESVDIEDKIYGRLYGGHYYLFQDFRIKQQFMDLIVGSIIDSSLKNWETSKEFEKALDIQDYDILIGAVCQLLFKDGLEYNIPCIHKDCGHVETVKIDLNKIRYNDYKLLTDDNIKTVLQAESDSINLEMIKAYKEKLVFERKIVSDGVTIHCETPSMWKYLQIGHTLAAKLFSGLHGESVEAKNFVQKLLSLASYSYLPWVFEIETDVQGPNWSISADRDIILHALDIFVIQEKDIMTRIEDEFIKKTKVSFMAYPGVKCPKCGGTPNDIKSDIYPADMQQLFFFLSYRILSSVGRN